MSSAGFFFFFIKKCYMPQVAQNSTLRGSVTVHSSQECFESCLLAVLACLFQNKHLYDPWLEGKLWMRTSIRSAAFTVSWSHHDVMCWYCICSMLLQMILRWVCTDHLRWHGWSILSKPQSRTCYKQHQTGWPEIAVNQCSGSGLFFLSTVLYSFSQFRGCALPYLYDTTFSILLPFYITMLLW